VKTLLLVGEVARKSDQSKFSDQIMPCNNNNANNSLINNAFRKSVSNVDSDGNGKDRYKDGKLTKKVVSDEVRKEMKPSFPIQGADEMCSSSRENNNSNESGQGDGVDVVNHVDYKREWFKRSGMYCKCCKSEFSRGTKSNPQICFAFPDVIEKHLSECGVESTPAKGTVIGDDPTCVQLLVVTAFNNEYCLTIVVRRGATFTDLSDLICEEWMEPCCGHMRKFFVMKEPLRGIVPGPCDDDNIDIVRFAPLVAGERTWMLMNETRIYSILSNRYDCCRFEGICRVEGSI